MGVPSLSNPVPGTVRGTGNAEVNEADATPLPGGGGGLAFLWEGTVNEQQTGKVCLIAC